MDGYERIAMDTVGIAVAKHYGCRITKDEHLEKMARQALELSRLIRKPIIEIIEWILENLNEGVSPAYAMDTILKRYKESL